MRLQEHLDKKRIDENYTQKELSNINVKADTVDIQVSDYDGNKTKYLGMNDKQALMAMKKFIEARLKHVK